MYIAVWKDHLRGNEIIKDDNYVVFTTGSQNTKLEVCYSVKMT